MTDVKKLLKGIWSTESALGLGSNTLVHRYGCPHDRSWRYNSSQIVKWVYLRCLVDAYSTRS